MSDLSRSEDNSSDRLGDLRLACAGEILDIEAVRELVPVLESMENYDEVLELLDRAVRQWPTEVDLLFNQGRLLLVTGHSAAASKCLLAVQRLDEHHVPAFVALTKIGRGVEAGDLDRCLTLQTMDRDDLREKVSLKRAEARLLEHHERYQESFEAHAKACEWIASTYATNMEGKIRGARAVLSDISPELVDRYSTRGHSSAQPIFIVGMPRSGTSLTEQFLDAHPKVHAVGEQVVLGQVLNRLVRGAAGTREPMIKAINDLSDQIWIGAGDQYLAGLRQLGGEVEHTTDKLPGNFGLLPFIRLIFPKAKVLHLRRHPLATLYSCIRQDFVAPGLSYSISDWARHYGVYRALMTAWTPILGEQMLTLDYEDLVSDFPTSVRKVINFLGLDWCDACLKPEENERIVKTASMFQVREPVHSSGIDTWQRCREQLEALLPIINETEDRVLSSDL